MEDIESWLADLKSYMREKGIVEDSAPRKYLIPLNIASKMWGLVFRNSKDDDLQIMKPGSNDTENIGLVVE